MNRLEKVNNKLTLVRDWLQSEGNEALLVKSQANFAWLTSVGENYIYSGDAGEEAYRLTFRTGRNC